jgi:transposase InsO family protein
VAKKAKVGYEFAHAIVDDHSRLAYAELLPNAKAATVTVFTERALAFFSAHGINARRLMTDNHWSYTLNGSLQELPQARGIEHLRTPKRRAQPNGKVEPFDQTMAREWAYGVRYRSSRHRAAALPHWLRYYNEPTPHNSLEGPPPASRVHNVRRQDT